VPAPAAAQAHESISNAVVVAEQLPPGPAAELMDHAAAAFTAGLGAAATVGMVLFAGLAVLAGVALRNVRL
jgi:DHA2 family multidrug resistance protein-like MFS transporter